MVGAMTAVLPQELLDDIVDLSCNDKSTLLLLLKSARAFGERCRMYIYREVYLGISFNGITQRSLVMRHCVTTYEMGRFVLSLRCILIGPTDTVAALSQLVSDFTLHLLNMRQLVIREFDTSFSDWRDLSPIIPQPNSLTGIVIHNSKHSVEGLLALMRRCPHMASLEFVCAGVLDDPPPISAVSSEGNRFAAVNCLRQLVLLDCKTRFLGLIAKNRLIVSWRGVRRLFLINDRLRPSSGIESAIKNAISFFRRNANLTFLYLTVRTYARESLVLNILDIPHVVLQCSTAGYVEEWLESLLTYIQDGRVQFHPRLVNLDVMLRFSTWNFLDKGFLDQFTVSLHQWGLEESFRLRFIVITDTDITEDDKQQVMQEFGQYAWTARLIIKDASWYSDTHLEFMEGDISDLG